MSCYKMLENIHVIIRNKAQINFWEQEIYNESEFAEGYLDVNLLIKEGYCREAGRDEEKNEE